MGAMEHTVLGVIGASGGLGTSTLCVALAVRGAPHVGATVCLDGAPGAEGLDVTACLEHVPGLRWPDLSGAQGEVDGTALLRGLPGDGTARVLAGSCDAVPDEVAACAVRALGDLCGLTVVDLGRRTELVQECTDLVLLSGTSARHLADASALVSRLDGRHPARLLLRMGRGESVSPEEVAVHLDLPLAGTVAHDGRVVADADRARTPGSRSSGALARAVDRLLVDLGLTDAPALARRSA
jgi:hypothetical protein